MASASDAGRHNLRDPIEGPGPGDGGFACDSRGCPGISALNQRTVMNF